MLDINTEITKLTKHPVLGRYLSSALLRIQSALNSLAKSTAADSNAILPAPAAIQALNIKTDGNGNVHGTISDGNPISKGLHYFVEYDTNANFTQPHVVHLGVSRTLHPMALPAKDDNGNAQHFFFRAYSQYPGGQPGPVVHFGGSMATPVAPGGSAQMTLLPSSGSGTAQANGQQGNSGFGRVLIRPAATVKRTSGK